MTFQLVTSKAEARGESGEQLELRGRVAGALSYRNADQETQQPASPGLFPSLAPRPVSDLWNSRRRLLKANVSFPS